MNIKRFYRSSANALIDVIDHDGIEHAGYLSFIFILAIFPFLVLLISIAGFIGELAIGERFIEFLFSNLPIHVLNFLKPRIDEIIFGPPESIVSIAILGAIWTASSSFEGLRTILNRAYRVNSPPAYILRRMLSIFQFLCFVVILMFIIFCLIFLPPLINDISKFLDLNINISPSVYYLRNLAIFLVLLIFIGSIYYFLPNIKQRLTTVLPGACITSLLWSISGSLLSAYISNFRQVNLIYGSLEGIIVTLIFFYINNIILIFGAEFNYHFANFKNNQLSKN
ncbi:MAG: YihY/virulence factor BrkB family protein [Sphingobacteriia bacterium]|nr:YihY/virulence factor BrkB family protein [Sphingobacteriia bacterium]